MDGFTFYKSFYDTIKKMRKPQDRIKIAFAILEYAFDDKEPEGLSEIAEIAFESFRHTLQKSKNNGGSARKKTKSNDNQNNETISKRFENDFEKGKSNDNQAEIVSKTSSSSSLSSSSKERLIDNQSKENNQTIEKNGNDPLSAFLKAYPSIEVDINSTAQLYGKDFELIREKFSESGYLRDKTNSLSWICRSYTDIIRDKYRDSTLSPEKEVEPLYPRKRVIGYHSDPRMTGEEV